MKKSIYYRTVFARKNVLAVLMNKFFFAIASYPRLVMEVIIRRNMGERYFGLMSCLCVAILLGVIPPVLKSIPLFRPFNGFGSVNRGEFYTNYETWYIFLLIFVVCSFVRWQETARQTSIFEFGRFSLSTGDIHPAFYKMTLFRKRPDVRTIEILLEPGVFFVAGIALSYMSQNLGILFIVVSILYSLSYVAAYRMGDEMIMDIIDEQVMAEETEDMIVNDKPSENGRGVKFYFRKPEASHLRKKLADCLVETTSENEEKTVLV